MPNLTRLRDTLDADELMELMESWLPLLSLDARSPLFEDGSLELRGVVIPTAVALELSLATLCTGAKSPYKGWQLKYLSKKQI